MTNATLRSTLLAGAACVALCGLASPASALTIVGPPASDFEVLESVSGNSGTFTVYNNSSGWYVYYLAVGNPSANSPGEGAFTTQNNWSATKTCVTFTGSSCSNAFTYENENGALSDPTDLGNDVGPGTSSNKFTFGVLVEGSPVTLDVVNLSNGQTAPESFNATEAPEPASMALLGMGMVGLWGARRRRKRDA